MSWGFKIFKKFKTFCLKISSTLRGQHSTHNLTKKLHKEIVINHISMTLSRWSMKLSHERAHEKRRKRIKHQKTCKNWIISHLLPFVKVSFMFDQHSTVCAYIQMLQQQQKDEKKGKKVIILLSIHFKRLLLFCRNIWLCVPASDDFDRFENCITRSL